MQALSFLHDCVRRLRAWWSHDRIRASPREGRLLRIEPGDLLMVRGRQAVVLARRIEEESIGTRLHLTCETDADVAELQLRITVEGELVDFSWNVADSRHTCDPSEIEVWPRRRVL